MEDMFSQSQKLLNGECGLPANYPVPKCENLLFYMQHNNNTNTVIYTPNLDDFGELIVDRPINVNWKCYAQGGINKKLNQIQEKLAYGYNSRMTRKNCYEFHLVSYNKVIFYLRKIDGRFRIITKINGLWSFVENIYVFTENLGIFPQVKYAEIYGTGMRYNLPVYYKIDTNL